MAIVGNQPCFLTLVYQDLSDLKFITDIQSLILEISGFLFQPDQIKL